LSSGRSSADSTLPATVAPIQLGSGIRVNAKPARVAGRRSYRSEECVQDNERQSKDMEKKANVVLVHGAWADGSSWSRVILLLQNGGLNVVGAQIPLTSIDDDVAVTRNLLSTQAEPVVLVAHSYGGVVISNAANDLSNVKALVYIAAFGLDEGESVEALGKQGPPPAGAAQIRPDGQGFLWIDRGGFAEAFASDADPSVSSVMAAVQRPVSVKCFAGHSGPPAWKHLP
jgi:pimeloyl-ACP methyl ester carboxylesterase